MLRSLLVLTAVGRILMYFWWKPGPSPFWTFSIFCDYGTAVSELEAGLSDTPSSHVQWSRPSACVCTICGYTEQLFTPPPKLLLGPTLCNKCSQCVKLHLGAKRTVWQDKTELWTFHNAVCLAAWADAEFHYLFKLLQICSKELSLVGRATRQEPARSRLTMTLTAFGAAETTTPAKQHCLPASEIGELEYSCRHLPTMIRPPPASPPGETLIQHLKQNHKTCLSVWELSCLSLPSTTRLYMQLCCCPGAGAQEQGTFSNSLTLVAVWETAGLWLAQGERLMLPRLGKAAQTCTPKESFSARPGFCHPDRTALGGVCCFSEAEVWCFVPAQALFHVIWL